ncbi:peptidylprolyl isomerase, partial [Poseidonibacter sp.]|uniref:peptidylprolyl isomerase n=1 Tax=Poseidonibacter sp. TaxID=2321188 RepID=UPI003C74D20E
KNIVICCMVVFLLVSCQSKTENKESSLSVSDLTSDQIQMPEEGDSIAVMTTSMGVVKMKLLDEVEPEAVGQFIKLAEEGYYNGLELFKPPSKERDAFINCNDFSKMPSVETHPTFKPVENPDYNHYTGAVGFTSFTTKDQGVVYFYTSFYVVTGDKLDQESLDILPELGFNEESIETYKAIGGLPWMDTDRNHPIFAHVYSGLEVLEEMRKGEAKSAAEGYGFEEPEYIESIVIQTYKKGDN